MKRTREQAAQTRLAIVTAAEELFFRHGFGNTTLEMIASQAGATRGAVYWYFSNKDEILLELVHHIHLPHFNEIILCPGVAAQDIMKSVLSCSIDWLMLIEADVSQQRLLSIVFHLDGVGHRKTLQYLEEAEAVSDRALVLVLEKLEGGQDLGLDIRVDDVACEVKWFLKGLCWSWLHSGKRFSLTESAFSHLGLFLNSICPDRSDRNIKIHEDAASKQKRFQITRTQ